MTTTEKPFAPACERNQAVILEVLKAQLRDGDALLLEIGTGTGQHAVHMTPQLSGLRWQTSDIEAKHAGILQWLLEANCPQVLPPLVYEIGKSDWPAVHADVVYCANVLHIISESLVSRLITDLGARAQTGMRFMCYGPFKYQGIFTSESNAEFDQWLKATDPNSGIRDFERIQSWLAAQQFVLVQDIQMPANNQFLIFEKT